MLFFMSTTLVACLCQQGNTALGIAHDVIYMMLLVFYMLFHPCSALLEHYMQLCICVATTHEQYSKMGVARDI